MCENLAISFRYSSKFFIVTDTLALKDVQLISPSAVRLGDTVLLMCKWTLEGNETLYSVKWYRGRQEFFSYLPKEFPFTRIFPSPGIDVDVSGYFGRNINYVLVLLLTFKCNYTFDGMCTTDSIHFHRQHYF